MEEEISEESVEQNPLEKNEKIEVTKKVFGKQKSQLKAIKPNNTLLLTDN